MSKPNSVALTSDTFELCFFVEPGSFLRTRQYVDGSGFLATMRQVTYRCGGCGQPMIEGDIAEHFRAHVADLQPRPTAVPQEPEPTMADVLNSGAYVPPRIVKAGGER